MDLLGISASAYILFSDITRTYAISGGRNRGVTACGLTNANTNVRAILSIQRIFFTLLTHLSKHIFIVLNSEKVYNYKPKYDQVRISITLEDSKTVDVIVFSNKYEDNFTQVLMLYYVNAELQRIHHS